MLLLDVPPLVLPRALDSVVQAKDILPRERVCLRPNLCSARQAESHIRAAPVQWKG